MLESKTKQIGDHVYLVRQLPATQAHKLLLRIGKVLGPALGGGLESVQSFELDAAKGIGKAISELFERATPDEVDAIVKAFADYSEVDGKPLKTMFDLHFAGKLSDMYRWLAFALEANYSDFFGVFKQAGGALAQAAARFQSPSTSSGQPGAASSSA